MSKPLDKGGGLRDVLEKQKVLGVAVGLERELQNRDSWHLKGAAVNNRTITFRDVARSRV